MSYESVLAEIHTRLATVEGIEAIVTGEPVTMQATPMVYSMARGFERKVQGNTVEWMWRTRHRLVVSFRNSPEEAEYVIIRMAVAIPNSLEAGPRGGSLPGGSVSITAGDAGFVRFQSSEGEYRCMDFYSEAIEHTPLGGT